jgi:23S rRNA pseudouridine1911/1915/1917 synthase
MIEKRIIADVNNERLDSYISKSNLDLSRSMVQKLIKENRVFVNGKNEKESYKIKANDNITIQIEEPKSSKLEAQDIPLDIIYEDNDIIVINKPKGMVVHPGNGNPDNTLVNAVLAHCKGSLSGIGGEIRPGIVHRIDKDTSGLIIVAKNDKSHINLSEQIKNHEVTKIYTALVKGNISEDEATIDMPIGRDKKDRKKMSVTRDGKEAVSHIKVVKRYGNYTLIRVKIDTGRTHQIRVHMAKIGHPVVGDEVYSSGKNEFGVKGQMLHSTILKFKHPISGKEIKLEAPLPQYFEDVLSKLEEKTYNKN